MTKISVDAMGGDYAPRQIVEGAVWAAHEYGVGIELVGKEDQIKAELERIEKKGVTTNKSFLFGKKKLKVNLSDLDITITHADEIIEMGEAPAQAIRKKKNSSITMSVEAVANGRCEAVVAAGSTGAAMAASLFGLGRLPGIERPVIAGTLPNINGKFVLVDAGANSSCTPEMLYQFAFMGAVFAQEVLKIDNPRVGILNIGEEAGKGNELAKNAYKLLEEHKDKLNFIGNVEGKEIFAGNCDVVVCDGFVGNVFLKVIEASSTMLFKMIKTEFKSSLFSMLLGMIVKPLFMNIYKKINYAEYGGALLLGVKGITVIAHGRSNAYAIKSAIRVAKESVETAINKKIAEYSEGN